MTQYPFTSPQLPFPYNFVTELVQGTEVYDGDEGRTVPDGCASLFVVPLTPSQLREFTSAFQAGADLIYPDKWQEIMDYWLQPSQYPNDLTWWAGVVAGVCEVSICDLVRDCIETDPGVIEAIQEIIREQGPGEDAEGENADYEEFERVGDVDDNLDCVYGALRDAYSNIIIPAWITLRVAITAATDFAGVLQELPFISAVTSTYIDAIDSLLINGTALYDAHMFNVATIDNVVCAMFDRICERGQPYRLRNEDITAGIAALATGAPLPFVNQLIGQVMSRQTFASYWKRRTDDACSNDWETICDCTPVGWCYESAVTGFFDPDVSPGSTLPTVTAGNAVFSTTDCVGEVCNAAWNIGDCTLNQIELFCETNTSNCPGKTTIQVRRNSDNTILWDFNVPALTAGQNNVFTFGDINDDVYIRLSCRTDNGEIVISRVRARGDNDPPSGAGNCN